MALLSGRGKAVGRAAWEKVRGSASPPTLPLRIHWRQSGVQIWGLRQIWRVLFVLSGLEIKILKSSAVSVEFKITRPNEVTEVKKSGLRTGQLSVSRRGGRSRNPPGSGGGRGGERVRGGGRRLPGGAWRQRGSWDPLALQASVAQVAAWRGPHATHLPTSVCVLR